MLAVFGVGLVATMSPVLCLPEAWDELVYHVALPFRWSQAGSALVLPDNPFSGFPALADLLFWLATSAGGTLAPRLMTWAISAIIASLLFQTLRRWLSVPAALALVAGFLFSPLVLLISHEAYAELFVVLDVAAAMYLLTASRQRTDGHGDRVLLGLLAGGAAAVKLTGWSVSLVIVFWATWREFRASDSPALRVRRAVTFLAWMLGVALAFAAPFYLRPWFATGNPFHPYFAEWFTSDAATLAMSQYHHDAGTCRYGLTGLLGVFAAPLFLAVPLKALQDSNVFDGCFGWQAGIVGIFTVLTLVRARWSRLKLEETGIGLTAVLLAVSWYLTSPQARFASTAFYMGTLTAGLALQQRSRPFRTTVLAALLIGAVASFNVRQLRNYANAWKAVVTDTRGRHLSSLLDGDYVEAMSAVFALTPPDATVMLLFENRGLYMPRRYIIATPFFQNAFFTPPEQVRTPAMLEEQLRRSGATHIMLGLGSADPDRLQPYFVRSAGLLGHLESLVKAGSLKPVWSNSGYQLFAVSWVR